MSSSLWSTLMAILDARFTEYPHENVTRHASSTRLRLLHISIFWFLPVEPSATNIAEVPSHSRPKVVRVSRSSTDKRAKKSGVEQVVYKGPRSIPQERTSPSAPSSTAWEPSRRPAPRGRIHSSATATADVLHGKHSAPSKAGKVAGESHG